MKIFNRPANIESGDTLLLQYESLRLQVTREEERFSARTLGLVLFIRHGMLAWMEMCNQCIVAEDAILDRQPESPALPYETRSEMIKVMANITLFNLKEFSHGGLTAHKPESDFKPSKQAGVLLYQTIHPEAGF
jgi:hypothetical protein